MKIINIMGGPGAGKSTLALGLAYAMKKQRLKVEPVMEYARELVLEGRVDWCKANQLAIFAEQHRRFRSLEGAGLEYVVTDGWFLQGLLYMKPGHEEATEVDNEANCYLRRLILTSHHQFNTFNCLIERHEGSYDPVGRYQTEQQARGCDRSMRQILVENDIGYDTVPTGNAGVSMVLKMLGHNPYGLFLL